ncbi:hypothetical protein BGX28_008603 [Mortierella sp. GBA30]|nr:hypothetical protein BGX28_008603 [Mortierella sp. GBA30]
MLLDKIKKKFDLSIVKSVELEDLAIDFTGSDSWSSALSSDKLVAHLAHIPGFNWPIRQVQLRDNGLDLGQLDSPFTDAEVNCGRVLSSISHSTLKVFPESHRAFADFIAALASKPMHTFSIKGSADIVFDLGKILGVHTIRGIDFVSDLTLKGLDGLRDITCTAITDIEAGEGDKVILKGLFDIQNSSQLALTLGECILTMSIESDGNIDFDNRDDDDLFGREHTRHRQQIGTIRLENLTLLLGLNDTRKVIMVLDSALITRQFLRKAAYKPQRVYLHGFQGTSKNEALAAGLLTMETSVVLPVFDAISFVTPDVTIENPQE